MWQCKDEPVDPTPPNNPVNPTDPIVTHTITSFSPASGEANTEVTVTGTGFPTNTSQIEVRVGNNSTMVVPSSATATQIKFNVPFQATTGKISIKVGTGTAQSATDFTVVATPAPSITQVIGAGTNVPRGFVSVEGSHLYRSAPNAPSPKYYMKNTSGQDVEMTYKSTTGSSFSNQRILLQIPENAVSSPIKVVTYAGQATTASNYNLRTVTVTNLAANLNSLGGNVSGLALNATGTTLYAVIGHAIYTISTTNTPTPVLLAGNPSTSGFVNATGNAARFYFPAGLTVDASNNVYVCDFYNHCIRKISSTGVVTTLAGTNTSGFVNGTGTAARFNFPTGIAINSSATTLYITDRDNHAIRALSLSNNAVTTYSGDGSEGSTNKRFKHPRTIDIDPQGNLYVTDLNQVVWRLGTTANTVIAGSIGIAAYQDGVLVGNQRFRNPMGITIPKNNATTGGYDIFIADVDNNVVRWCKGEGVGTTIAGAPASTNGTTAGASGITNGSGVQARFEQPSYITSTGTANNYTLYVTSGGNTIRKITVVN